MWGDALTGGSAGGLSRQGWVGWGVPFPEELLEGRIAGDVLCTAGGVDA